MTPSTIKAPRKSRFIGLSEGEQSVFLDRMCHDDSVIAHIADVMTEPTTGLEYSSRQSLWLAVKRSKAHASGN